MESRIGESGLEKKSHFVENWTALELQGLIRHLGSWSLGKGPLHEKLVRALTQAVRHGFVLPGTRLPSERSLSQALQISRTTVVAAYDALREAGWLESRPGSGTWVRSGSAVASAQSSARAETLGQSPLMNLLGPQGEDRLDLALGTPFPLEDLPSELLTVPPGEYAALMRDRFYYPLGFTPLRKAVAAMYTRAGLPTTEEQVLITNGAQSAIWLCTSLWVQRGDAVLVEDPAYFGALDAFRTAGARMTILPVETEGVRPGTVADRMKSAGARLAYLTPTFQNPTGSVMPAGARKEIARIVTESGVPLIDDGTLADLALEGEAPPPIAAYGPKAPVATVGSLSKLACPGLRIGWVRAPEWIVERLGRLKSSQDLASPLVTQAIAVRVLESLAEVKRLRREQLRPRRDLLVELLGRELPEWSFRAPEGGLFLWVKLPRGDARELAQVGLRHGLVLLPGPHASAVGRHVECLRIPFLAAPEMLRTGVRRLVGAWRDYEANGRVGEERVAVV
jgi:DNA-binding transcriptional MocR family regulator